MRLEIWETQNGWTVREAYDAARDRGAGPPTEWWVFNKFEDACAFIRSQSKLIAKQEAREATLELGRAQAGSASPRPFT